MPLSAFDPVFLVSGLVYVVLSAASRLPGSSKYLKVGRFILPVCVALAIQYRRAKNLSSYGPTECPGGTVCPFAWRQQDPAFKETALDEIDLAAELGPGYGAADLERFQLSFAERFLCADRPVVVRNFQSVGLFSGVAGADALLATSGDAEVVFDTLNYTELLLNGPSADGIVRGSKPLGELLGGSGGESALRTAWYARWAPRGGRNTAPAIYDALSRGHDTSVGVLGGAALGVCSLKHDPLTKVEFKAFDAKVRVGQPGYSYPMHFDLMHNFAQQVAGEKHVTLFSPRDVAHLYPPIEGLFKKMAGFSYWSEVIDPYRFDLKKRFPRMRGATAHTALLREGDVVFVPALWMHYFHSAAAHGVMTNTFIKPLVPSEEDGFSAFVFNALPEEWLQYREETGSIIPQVSQFLWKREQRGSQNRA